MNFNKNLKFLFILFYLKLIDSFLMSNQTVNDFNCGVNDSNFKFDAILGPKVRPKQKSVAIVEIAIFYDQAFYDRFSNKLETFIKSVMRQVQIIFQYPSMKSQVDLVVTRLIKINTQQIPKATLVVEYLDSFCKFQFTNYWQKDKDYDLGLLFTGSSFYMNHKDSYFTKGVAKIKGVCYTLGSNCALATVHNFMDSWYVAHEIAHTLGANHDQTQNQCQRGIMGPHADRPFTWSDCTDAQIAQIITDPGHGVCLHNEPQKVVWDFRYETSLPSDSYSSDDQCATYFGQKYARYDGNLSWLPPVLSNPCAELWCIYDLIKASAKCPLEGTECSQNNRRGKCKVGRCVF